MLVRSTCRNLHQKITVLFFLALPRSTCAPRNQKALYELCIEHLSVLVSRAEHEPFQDHLEPDAWATATAGAAAEGETAGIASFQPQDDPQVEPVNEKGPSPTRGSNFSIVLKAESPQKGGGDGCRAAGGRDGLRKGDACGDTCERVGLRKPPHLQRQASSMDSHGAASVMSRVGGEFHTGIGVFLLSEEEQVQPMLARPFFYSQLGVW